MQSITGERLKKCRKEADKTLEQVGDVVGVHKSTIMRWENGDTERIGLDMLRKLADYYKVNPAWLMGADVQKSPKAFATDAIKKEIIEVTGSVPIYGSIPAGYPAFEQEEVLGYQAVNVRNPDEYFCLRVHGDSMVNKGIIDGCIVLIHVQNFADNGQIVACRVNGDEATLKIFMQNHETVVLSPANPNYQPIIIPASQFESGEAAIYGVVRQIIIDL